MGSERDQETVQSCTRAGVNQFQNDGSFMELFKKRMEEQKKRQEEQEQAENECRSKKEEKKSLLRRTIPQKKIRRPSPGNSSSKVVPKKPAGGDKLGSAWEAYMREVEAYKTNSCADDDRFSRPLCK